MTTPTFQEVLGYVERARKNSFADVESPDLRPFFFEWVFHYLPQVVLNRNFGRYLHSDFYHAHSSSQQGACQRDASSPFGFGCIRRTSDDVGKKEGFPTVSDVLLMVNSHEGRTSFKLSGEDITYRDLAVVGLSERQAFAYNWVEQKLTYDYRVHGVKH